LRTQDIKIKKAAINPKKFLGIARNSLKKYKDSPRFSIVSPFNFMFDQINSLFMIVFEDDSLYYQIELQIFKINNVEYPLVILYRKDGLKDLYYTDKKVLEDRENMVKDILPNASLNQPDSIDFNMEVDDNGFKCEIFLKDKFEREIEIKIDEMVPDRELYSFLVPSSTKELDYFPLVYLRQFGMIHRDLSEILIKIDNKELLPVGAPFKLEGNVIYQSRFSLDPIMCNWNYNFEGYLEAIDVNMSDMSIFNNNLIYKLIKNNNYNEIKSISASDNSNHILLFEFSPPIPNFLSLKDKIKIKGKFSISIEGTGIIAGEYQITTSGKKIVFKVDPSKAVHQISKILWFETYKWIAELEVINENTVKCISYWKRN